MKKSLMIITVISLVVVGLIGTASFALADPFLCPAVGGPNGAGGPPGAGGPLPGGQNTFLPGQNQAGTHANENALNTLPAGLSPGPGNGNSDWSPIWPY